MLYIAKGFAPLSVVENPWLWRLFLQWDGKVQFLRRKARIKEHILAMLISTMDKIVLLHLVSCAHVYVPFDLWMSHCGFDTFFIVMNFMHDKCVAWHVTVVIFKVADIFGVAIAMVIKFEGANLNMLATTLKSMVKY